LIQFALSTGLSYLGYWYLLWTCALALAMSGTAKTRSPLSGFASAAGVVLTIVLRAQGGGFEQAGLLSRIIGIPGAQALPLALTLAYSFALGTTGWYAGSALSQRTA
jgi:hypothetical protein